MSTAITSYPFIDDDNGTSTLSELFYFFAKKETCMEMKKKTYNRLNPQEE